MDEASGQHLSFSSVPSIRSTNQTNSAQHISTRATGSANQTDSLHTFMEAYTCSHTHTHTHTTINAQNSIRQPPGGAKTSSTSVYHPLSSKRIGAAGGMGILNVLTANSSQLVTELIKTEQQCATVYHNMNQQVACPSALIGICSAEFHTGILLPSSTRLVV